MNEVNTHAIKGSAKVREAVQCDLLDPPVKLGAPVVDQLLNIGQIRAIVPGRAPDLTGPAGAGEALTQLRQHLVDPGQRADGAGRLGPVELAVLGTLDDRPPRVEMTSAYVDVTVPAILDHEVIAIDL